MLLGLNLLSYLTGPEGTFKMFSFLVLLMCLSVLLACEYVPRVYLVPEEIRKVTDSPQPELHMVVSHHVSPGN